MHCSQTLLLDNATTSWVICADEVMNHLICVSAHRRWMPEAAGADGTIHPSVQNLTAFWQKKKYSDCILPTLASRHPHIQSHSLALCLINAFIQPCEIGGPSLLPSIGRMYRQLALGATLRQRRQYWLNCYSFLCLFFLSLTSLSSRETVRFNYVHILFPQLRYP